MRPCQVDTSADRRHRENVSSTSAKKLLEVSLHNLDKLGHHYYIFHYIIIIITITSGKTMKSNESRSHNFVSNIDTFPTIDYIQGATWLGRNIAVLAEDLYHSIEDLRSKQISEISAISIDKDIKRCCYRLQNLLTSSLTEARTLCADTSNNANKIVEQAVRLVPGNLSSFEEFANKLPIDAVLRKSDRIRY